MGNAPHEIDLVVKAIDLLLVGERVAKDLERAERYGGVKSSFYPSEFGDGDRKLVYKFFADRIGVKEKLSGQNVRVFDNGDYVHLRYRDYMVRLGALLSEETALKVDRNKLERLEGSMGYDDNFNYKISGRYDQIIDLHVIRAFNAGIDQWEGYMAANYDAHDIVTSIVDTTAGALVSETKSTRWVPKAGYTPDPMVIDVKSMNPWGFRNLVEKNDHSDIQGYYDQVVMYEDELGIHKGGLLIEDKEKNRLHGVPIDYDRQRINGGGPHEGLKNRLARIWDHVKQGTVPAERCAGAKRDKFPCLWSTGQCQFYSHCWNEEHNGLTLGEPQEEEQELPTIEELLMYLTDPEYGVSGVVLYLENFPGGQDRFVVQANMPQPLIEQMLDYYADYVHNVDYLDMNGNVLESEQEAAAGTETITVAHGTDGVTAVATFTNDDENIPVGDGLTDASGNFILEGTSFDKATERVRPDGEKEINCVKCQHLIVYKVLRGAKECPKCHHKNAVQRT